MNKEKIVEKIKNIIEENPIKTFLIIAIFTGLFYLGIYYINNQFFPTLSNQEFIQLSMIFFVLSIPTFLFLIIIIFLPAELLYNLKYGNKKDEKILIFFSLLILVILFIGTGYYTYTLLKNKHYTEGITCLICLVSIVIYNGTYYVSKKTHDFKRISVLILVVSIILNIFLDGKLSNIISNIFHLGNYKTTILINNKDICQNISKYGTNNTTCLYAVNIIWNKGSNYLIKINNTTYKIPSKYILMEYFSNSKKYKTKKE
jgi:uncharacterized membrane protein